MPKVKIGAHKVSQINFKNNIAGTQQLQISQNISYNVRFSGNNVCEGVLGIKVFDPENDNFNIEFAMNGLFQFDPSLEKEIIHVETFKLIYPLANAFLATFTVNAGLPPIYLQEINIEEQEIYSFDMGGRPE